MTIFKYIPYLFLILGLFFIYQGITQYANGQDGLPSFILAFSAVIYFFVRLWFTRRYNNPKQ